jgi:hypothetical protein
MRLKQLAKKLRDRFARTRERVTPRRTSWEHLEEDLLGGHPFFRRWAVILRNNWRRVRRWWKGTEK